MIILKTLGIIGGMGPFATQCLFKKIIMYTDAKSDQEHVHIIIDNNTTIPDRTSYILGKGENPEIYLVKSAIKLEMANADFIIMPCNTAHFFYSSIIKYITIPFLNMITETAVYITNTFKGLKRIGLLATQGVYKTGIYDKALGHYGIEVLNPNSKNQVAITDLIYNIKEGNINVSLNGFDTAVDEISARGAEVIILGCTELSIAYEMFQMKGNFVDPLTILAKAAIIFAGKRVKEDL